MTEVLEETQKTLFDLSSKEIHAYWTDEKQPLTIPNNPLHWKAHKLQVLLEVLMKQAKNAPSQFNSKNYIDALDKYTETINAIKTGKDSSDETVLDKGKVASIGDTGATPTHGNPEPISMDS